MSYIYLSTNNINGKKYVGQHRYNGVGLDPNYFGSGIAINDAYNKHGRENFTMELLEECADEDLNEREVFYIKLYNTLSPNGYNLTSGGHAFHHSEETKQKMSESRKGHDVSECTRKKLSKLFKGRKYTEEARKNMSEAAKLRFSEEERKRLSDINKGRKHTEETKLKRSKALKGHKHSEETKRKISEKNKGRKVPEELKQKMSKPINLYDDNGVRVKTYSSINEMARQLGCSRRNINSALKGVRKKVNGFRVRFASEYGDRIEPYIKPQHHNQKQVNQYSLNGKYIKTWNSIAEIESECGYNSKAINNSCRMKTKSSCGFQWRYTNECYGTSDITPCCEPTNKQKQINQFALTGEFIKTWDSIADIKNVCGYEKSCICMCCKGKKQSAYGYMWRYADECCGTDNITPYQ